MVHALGSFALELFAPEGRSLSHWPLSPAAWKCAQKAISPPREERYPTVAAFAQAWAQAL